LSIERNDSTVYTQQLDRLESKQDQVLEKLTRLERERDVDQLDREWESAVDEFMITDKHGGKRLPSEGAATFAIVVTVAFGLFWMFMASRIAPPIALFGILFIGFGVYNGLRVQRMAAKYRQAEKRYRMQRNRLLSDD
jgi:hypothetical protein